MDRILFLECQEPGYAKRTNNNVELSQGTLIIRSVNSTGERCTLNACEKYKRPYLVFDHDFYSTQFYQSMFLFKNWVAQYGIVHLNVAGNGIYTLNGMELTQKDIDLKLINFFRVLRDDGVDLLSIRSGGQTGVDQAAIAAALYLKITAVVFAPRGWVYRDKLGIDHKGEYDFKQRFDQYIKP